MVDVFISYSREDQAHVRRLADAVKREGYSVWWDDELPPHLSYGDVITEKIGEAKAAIVVWSQTAAQSEWVRAEADVARNQKKLIQTSIDGRMPPMPFNQIQFADIGDWQGEADHSGWRKVKASLTALCGGDAPERPLYTMPSGPPPAAKAQPHRWHKVLIAVIAVAFLFIAGAGVYAWMQGRSSEPAPAPASANTVTASEDMPAMAPPPVEQAASGERFNRAAVIDDPDGYTNVRGGPSADAFPVGRVNRGEVFTTFTQDGDWWRVRLANGTEGYMARSRIRLIEPGEERAAAAPATAPAPARERMAEARPAAAPAPQRQPGQRETLTPEQLQMRRFCMHEGHGTPQCRRFFQHMQTLRKEGTLR